MPRSAVDERGFEAIRRIRAAHPAGEPLPLAEFKAMVRDQFLMLLIDEKAAVASLPGLLASADPEIRRKAFGVMRDVLSVREAIAGEVAERLRQAAPWFGVDPARALDKVVALSTVTKIEGAKAS
jgi:hypothetical protein